MLARPLHPAPPSLSFRELLKSIRRRGEEGERGRRRKESGCNSRLITFSDRSVLSRAPCPQTNRKLGSRGAWGQRHGPLAARAPEPLCAGPGRPGRSPRFVWRALGPRRGPASCSFVPRAWPPGTHPANARPKCCGMRSAVAGGAASPSPYPQYANPRPCTLPATGGPPTCTPLIMLLSPAGSSGGRHFKERVTCFGELGAWGHGRETGSVSFPCIKTRCIFLVVRAAIEPLPNVVELWQAEEGELLLPTQVRTAR